MAAKKTSNSKNGEPQIITIKWDGTVNISKEGKLRRCEIGQSVIGATEKVLLVVGETGAGKTSLIHFVLNYLLDVKFEDNVRYRLDVDEEESRCEDQSQSQTRWISCYKLNSPKRDDLPCITIIDTPGFGDTGGEEFDRFTNKQIRQCFTTKGDWGLDHIDAVIFVMKANINRLSNGQKYIFDSVLKLFGKDISENIFLFMTHALPLGKPQAVDAARKGKVPFQKYYKFDNNFLVKEESIAEGEKDIDEYENFEKVPWKMGCRSLAQFFTDLSSTVPKSLLLSADVLTERERLEITMEAIPDLIKDSIVTLHKLKVEQDILEEYENVMDKNKAFEGEEIVHVIEERQITNGEFAMICKKCKFTCHRRCGHTLTQIATTCSVMNWISVIRGCSVCPGSCGPGDHAKENFTYEKRAVTRNITNEEIKQLYDAAKNSKRQAAEKTRVMHTETVLAEKKINDYMEKARKCLKRLDEIALRPGSQTLANYIDRLVENERKNAEDGWEDRVRELTKLHTKQQEISSMSLQMERLAMPESEEI